MKSYQKPTSHRLTTSTCSYPKTMPNNTSNEFVASWSERANIDRILHENIDPCIKPENKLINTPIQHTNVHINNTSLLANHIQECNQRNDVIVEVEESHSGVVTSWWSVTSAQTRKINDANFISATASMSEKLVKGCWHRDDSAFFRRQREIQAICSPFNWLKW